MKKLTLIALVAAVSVTVTGCGAIRQFIGVAEESSVSEASSEPEFEPDSEVLNPSTPQGAANELFRGAQNWDTDLINSRLPIGANIESRVPPALENTLTQVLDRMEYTVGEATIDGDSATVVMEITAVDADSAFNDAVGAAVTYVVKQQIAGKPVNDYNEIAQQIIGKIDIAKLPTKTTTATAHMVKDESGKWVLSSSEDNLALLNAASGGALDMVDKVKGLAEQYGIPLN